MGLWISATLNRYTSIGGGNDYEDVYEYSERVEKTYINPSESKKIADKYGVYLETAIVDDYEHVLFMIHNKKSEVRDHFYSGEIYDFPDVKDDETFFQRSEDFIKEFIVVFPDFADYEFSPVGKRFIASS